MTGEPVNEEPSRRQWVGYWSMIVQQTQNAFNDKMAQFILIPLGGAVGFMIPVWSGFGIPVESAAGVMIALPFVLFAPLAGWVSDRFSKRDVMVGAACAQLGILGWICLSVWMGNMLLALCGFFALAIQSAFFGPAKMGINKELVGSKHLGFATGIQQMMAMLAILAGQIVAGWWFDKRYAELGAVPELAWEAAMWPLLILFLTGVPALMFAWIVPRVPAQGGKKLTAKVVVSHFANLSELWKDVGLRSAACGVAFFWGIAAFINLWSVKLAKFLTGGGEGFGSLSSGFMAAASLGMAVGFGVASYLLRKRIELGFVPLAGAGMALTSLLIVWLPFSGALFLVVLAVLAFASALFLAPLNAWLQDRYPANKRGEFQAAVNLMDCLAGILAVVAIEGIALGVSLLGLDVGWGIRMQMLFAGVACLVATAWITKTLPSEVLGLVGNVVVKLVYKIRVADPERMPLSGGVLVLPNHLSYIDACLLHVSSPRRLRFVMDERYASRATISFFTKLFDTVLIRRGQPLEAIRAVIGALNHGDAVCYFPEGQLSRTGGLSPLERGFELIACRAGVPVMPVWIDGIWGSIFSYERNRFFDKMPRRGRLHVTVAFGEEVCGSAIDCHELRRALMAASAAAIHERFSGDGWENRSPRNRGVGAEGFEFLKGARRRSAWVNGHQIRMVNALQAGEPLHVWRSDPFWQDCFGLLVGFAEFVRAKVVVEEELNYVSGQVWVGGDALRDQIEGSPPGVPITVYDFSSFSDKVIEVGGVEHFPCQVLDGLVVAMSMPQPDEVPDGFDPQLGRKDGSRGRVLPGWAVRETDAGVELYGPAAPDGLALPKGWIVDGDGFLVKA